MKYKAGDVVSWVSQSQGSATKKCGTVVAIVPKGSDVFSICPALRGIAKTRIKADFHSLNSTDRYLVEVDRGYGKNTWFYTPHCGVVDRYEEKA